MTQLVPFIIAVTGLIGGVGGFVLAYRKVLPEIESTTTATAVNLVKTLSAEMEILRTRITQLEARDEAKAKRIDDLEEGVRVLHEQIRELGHTPIWPTPARRNHQGD